ncbi:MAG: TetR/AcrR family transcriptional regulator [Desulfobacterales bacterium]|nr:TetR/AcrR family transcriptional regulator [Desulfobacterales bacterium]
MNYSEFKKKIADSMGDVCREAYLENQGSIRVKKEKTAVKNFKKIFDAVFKITRGKGFQAMSMRDLSNETALSMGALYGYFSSKEELLGIIQRQGRAMIKRVLDDFSGSHEDPVEKLRAVIKAHLFLSEMARPWFFFNFMEARSLNQEELKATRRMEAYTENTLVEILELGEKTGAFKELDHRMTAGSIKAMQQEWYLKRWKYAKRDISVDQYAAHVIEFVEAFCAPRPGGASKR